MTTQLSMERILAVGVDPHREQLDVVGIKFPERIVFEKQFANSPAGHRALLRTVRAVAAEHELSPVFGLEDSGNYGYTLGRYLAEEHCRVKEINPRLTSRQRDFYGQDKTNRIDALATAAVVLRAYERLPDVTAVQEATQATRELSRYREQLVKQQTAAVNRLHSRLAQQYPAYKTFFGRVHGVTALHFWARYPTPAHLQDVTPGELAAFLTEKSNHALGAETAAQILAQVDGVQSPEPSLLRETQGALIRDLAQRLLHLKCSIKRVEARLEESVAATGQQLTSFKGVSTVLAGMLIGETVDTARFDNDKDKFAKYNGTAPATEGTGTYAREIENKWCNHRLKHAFTQLALTARQYQPLSRQYYQNCLNRGLDKAAAQTCLMRRLSDVIFAMMRDKSAYDLEVHRRKQKAHKQKGKRVASAATGGAP